MPSRPRVDCLYITVDMDVFDESVAPGVSARNTDGIGKGAFFHMYRMLLNSGKVVGIDTAELCPHRDLGNAPVEEPARGKSKEGTRQVPYGGITADLAAEIVYEGIRVLANRPPSPTRPARRS